MIFVPLCGGVLIKEYFSAVLCVPLRSLRLPLFQRRGRGGTQRTAEKKLKVTTLLSLWPLCLLRSLHLPCSSLWRYVFWLLISTGHSSILEAIFLSAIAAQLRVHVNKACAWL